MIIRSQDKTTITNDLNVRITEEERILSCSLIEEFPHQAMYRILDSKNVVLGDYSTEEKAIKVLDMICDSCRHIAFIDEQAVVFNMPQDSDV